MWIERKWEAGIRTLAKAFPVVLITGPRQVGKTSLLRHLFPGTPYVTFDDRALAEQADSSPDVFFDHHPPPLIIDEVQYVPSLFRELKTVVDRAPKKRGQYLLTGSQTFPLMQEVSESLAGRCGILPMNTLSFEEISAASPDTQDLAFLARGGYPALHDGTFEAPADFYASYVATYLERDVRNLKNVGDLRDFDRLLRAAALRSGQILSYADLARDVGVSPHTAKAWVSVLEASGQVLLLEPYHRNLTTRLVKSPKLYFLDTGLVCHLAGIRDPRSLVASPMAGALWETFVVGQVVRHFQVRREKPPLWFWRTAQGDEVDLLVEHGGRFIAIECKLTIHPEDRDLRGLRALEAYYGEGAIERAFVACRTPHEYAFRAWPRAKAVGVEALTAGL